MGERLVRDKIPAVAKSRGLEWRFRAAKPEEMVNLLLDRLIVETNEVRAELSKPVLDQESVLTEVADLIDVLYKVIRTSNLSWVDINRVRGERLSSRGGFDDGVVWIE